MRKRRTVQDSFPILREGAPWPYKRSLRRSERGRGRHIRSRVHHYGIKSLKELFCGSSSWVYKGEVEFRFFASHLGAKNSSFFVCGGEDAG